MFSSPDIL